MEEKFFSELDKVDEEGNVIPFEETITYEDSIFYEDGISTPPDRGEKLLLRFALKKLTPQQKKVIQCIYFEGMTHQETADFLDLERSVVTRHLNSALKKMKKICLDK